MILLCYIDDFFLFPNQEGSIEDLQHKLNGRVCVNDLGKPKRLPGLDLSWYPDGSRSPRQIKLIGKLLEDTGMEIAKPVGISLDQSSFVSNTESKPLDKSRHAMYQSIIGCLMYLEYRTRPDLGVTDSMPALHFNEFTSAHLLSSKRALRYLISTKHKKMILKQDENKQHTVYVDESWSDDVEKGRRSRLGMLMLYGNPVVAATITNKNALVSV